MDIEVIEPNEYIRTEKGHISKNLTPIPWIAKDTTIDGDLVAKHSKNLLDLIEVGDIVEVLVNKRTNEILRYTLDTESDLYLLRKDAIKTILTHEQYAQNCYRMEE